MTDRGQDAQARRGPADSLASRDSADGADVVWDGTDDQLCEIAAMADPTAPLARDAVPWRVSVAATAGLLPEWYMPAPTARFRRRGTMAVIAVIVLAFVVIDASGLCVTSGFLSWA